MNSHIRQFSSSIERIGPKEDSFPEVLISECCGALPMGEVVDRIAICGDCRDWVMFRIEGVEDEPKQEERKENNK